MNAYFSILGSTALIAFVFFLIEWFVPGEDQPPVASRLFNYLYYPFVLAWVMGLQIVLAPLYIMLIGAAQGGALTHVLQQPTGPIAMLAFALGFAVIWDVWQYWVHRWQHTSSVLWQTHKLHHADTAINASSQARQHLLNYLLFNLAYAPMLMLFGSLSPHVIATFVMFRLWGFVIHANVRIHLGPLTGVISGPQWHRIHHSRQPEHLDRNFAVFFPFIDMLFGTYYRPGRDEYPPTGLAHETPEPILSGATVAPFVVWWRGLTRRRTIHVRQTEAQID